MSMSNTVITSGASSLAGASTGATPGDRAFDAVVIGGGLMGCMVARDLALAGMRVVLFERRAGLCMEASSANTGALMLQLVRASFIAHAMRTIELWRSAPQWLGADPHYVRNGGLTVAYNETEAEKLEEWMAARRGAGAPIEIISGNQARELEPALTEKIALASFCDIDGYADSKLTGQVFRHGLVTAGVELHTAMPVTGIDKTTKGFSVHAGSQTFAARRIVMAGGAWLGKMSAWLGVDLPVECRINQVLVTERLPPLLKRSVCAATGRLSLKQSQAGTMLIGGGWQGLGAPDGGRTELITEHVIANLRIASHTVPALRHARLVRSWLGFEAKAPDYLPMVGPLPGVDDAYIIGAVHAGYTVGLSLARALAETILGREPEVAISEQFDPVRLLPGNRESLQVWGS